LVLFLFSSLAESFTDVVNKDCEEGVLNYTDIKIKEHSFDNYVHCPLETYERVAFLIFFWHISADILKKKELKLDCSEKP
ncbi:hypothetical protein PENTCL1PPCAC_28188, partial [Pristionchus entomophagus]